MFKKILSFVVFILVISTAYLLIHTLNFKSKQINFTPAKKIEISDSAIHHLSRAIKIKTISPLDPIDFDSVQFVHFSKFLSSAYPFVENNLLKTTINQYSYLYRWQGSNEQLKPVILVAHYDVFPVPDEDLDDWTMPPFSGEIKDEILWGRGALNDKVSVVGILEAVEHLLSKGYKPERTVYLAIGYDTEIGGLQGAQSILKYLKQQGIQPEFVMDEGCTITRGLVPGVLTDVASIGIAEKGFASLQLSVKFDVRHSSVPYEETANKIIANAISKLESTPFPPAITEPVHQFLEHVGPEMRFQEKLVYANSHIFKSVIMGIYQQTGQGLEMVQTTIVPKLFNSGYRENIIPSTAKATINFSILPGLSIKQLIHRVTAIVDDDRIEITLKDFYSEASKVSSISTKGYSIIHQSIKEIFPYVITVPNLQTASTDGRYYDEICDNVYRFLPVRLNPDNIKSVHGINENIAVDEFRDLVRFYVQLIENCRE